MATLLRERRWAWVRLTLIALLLATLSTFLLAFPFFPSGRLALEEGDVAPRDIRAPRRITYQSSILTAEQQRLAEATVEQVYTAPDADIARQQLERTQQVLDYLTSVRADTLASPSQRRAWVRAVPELGQLPVGVADGLLALSEESWGRVQSETFDVVAQAMRRGVRDGFLEQTWREIPSLVGLDLSAEEAAITAALAQWLLVPNSFYDEAATQAAREQARNAVDAVLMSYETGEIIVREGQRITPLHLEALRMTGLQQPRTRWSDVVTYAFLALCGVFVLMLYLARFQADVLQEMRKFFLLALLLALFLLLARLMVPDRVTLRYLFPASALAMLVTATMGPSVGVIVSALIGFAAAMIGDQSLELAAYVTFGGLVAAIMLGRVDRVTKLFRAALFVAVAQVAVLLGFDLLLERVNLIDLALRLLMAIVNAGVSASFALGLLFLVGPLFDIITAFRLIDLSRPNHPLLQRLLREAPGTYHHSLMVASLAEQAAESIGADALLTRVGAYYHDVGKVARPYFFVENQIEGVNPHERLDPTTSVEIIVGHVRDGMELARRYRLPARVRAFISEHHGTKRASFQYERAVELAGGDASRVHEADFRHKGPKPRSKETTLVMLADGCEAIARSRRPTTPEALAEAVNTIFEHAIRSGQLDESPIRMSELVRVKESFIATLKGVFHPRLIYPQLIGETHSNAEIAPTPAGG